MNLSKFPIISGIVMFVLGVVLKAHGSIPWVGKLPGDFYIKTGNFTLYLPLGTCALLSLLLTLTGFFFRK